MNFVDFYGIFATCTVDGRNPANHLGFIKPRKQWDIYTISTGDRRISEPSTGQDLTDTRKPTSFKWMEMVISNHFPFVKICESSSS